MVTSQLLCKINTMTSYSQLPQFGFLLVEGKDARSFLQGYTTCDMNQVSGPDSRIGSLCNIQGRMVTSFRILEVEDGFLLRMHRELVTVTEKFLQKYILFSKASMSDLSDNYRCYGIVSNQPVTTGKNQDIEGIKTEGYLLHTSGENRYELWTQTPLIHIDSWTETPQETWNLAEIMDGLVWISGNTSETFIPQMLNYHDLGGVSFDKGCYLGQEIIARMQFRGELKRRLFRARALPGGKVTHPVAGDEILDHQGKNAGEVVACAADNGEIELLAVLKVRDNPGEYHLASGEPLNILG